MAGASVRGIGNRGRGSGGQPHRLWLLLVMSALFAPGCVQRGASTAGEAAERWIEAVNVGSWERACDVTDWKDETVCETRTRQVFDGKRLQIEGPIREVEPDTNRLLFSLRAPPQGVGAIAIVRRKKRYLVSWME